LEPGEHYRHDLIGYRVHNLEGVDFGTVEGFEDLPANAVMVVRGERERWLPVSREHLREIDDAAKTIRVDWPEDL
jgi:16S rRNA processing protein RimM